jgi:hypothetical protein
MARTVITAALAGALSVALLAAPAEPAAAQGADARSALTARAQAPAKPKRPRARVRVTPAYPYRTFSTDYPVPYQYEYPGPGFVRQCTSWLAPENRPSGPVIVPRMRCWWQPGVSAGP